MPSSQKLQIWLKPNCTWIFIRWSSTNFTFFVPIWNSKWRLRHLGFPIGIKNRNFVEDLPMIIPGQFGFNCPSGFREEAFWNIFNVQMPSSQKLQIWLKPNCTWMFIGWSSTKRTFFVPIWNSKWRLRQDLVSWISDRHKKHIFYRGPSSDHSWAVWFQLSKWFQRRSVLKHF
jgi:hypothetical protein